MPADSITNSVDLKHILANFKDKRVIVIGDFYLDEYIHCQAVDFSPEAPVPRARVKNVEHIPGCAGNVAMCFRNLGAQVVAAGVIGNDHNGTILRNKLLEAGILTTGLISDPKRVTGVFSRVLLETNGERKQHLVRYDLENKGNIEPETINRLLEFLIRSLENIDIIFIADYDETEKGEVIIPHLIASLRPRMGNKVILAGTSRKKIGQLEGCHLVFCNQKEAQFLSQPTERSIRQFLKADTVIITKGSNGVSIFTSTTEAHLPSYATKVVDVCGAGDAFATAYALASTVESSVELKCEIASHAAAIAVGKMGTAPVYPEEIMASLQNHRGRQSQKMMELEELSPQLQKLKREGKKVVFTNGYFDSLNQGHITFLTKAKKEGEILVVAINSDRSTRENKGQNPAFTAEERAETLSAIRHVDYVTIFDELTPLRTISQLRPDILVKGNNYQIEEVVGKEIVESYGGTVRIIDNSWRK